LRYCSEFLAPFQQKSYATPLVVARLFNCYGPRATHPYIIPEIIRQLNDSSTLHLGNLTERDFTYVHDTARAVTALLTAVFPPSHSDGSSLERLEIVSIGSGSSHSISYLAQRLASIMEISDFKLTTDDNHQRPNDIPHFKCSNKKLRKYTNWMPEVEIEEGLRKTVGWFKVHGCRWNLSQND
jgi:nucleoside-diphosphate-sugar epimerase